MKKEKQEGKESINAVGRNEWKVLLSLFILVIALETLIRGFGPRFSADVRHLEEISAIAARFEAEAEQGQGRTILIVGNSLARNGIDASQIQNENDRVEFFTPDASAVTEWSWGLRRYFQNTGAEPDEIWLVTGRSHLLDRPAVVEKLGAYFVGVRDLRGALNTMDGNESRIRLILGRCSTLFANRYRVFPIVGYRFLPGFAAAWPKLAATGLESEIEEVENREPVTESLDSLRRFLEAAREMQSKVTVVAIPMSAPYQLPEEISQVLEEFGVSLVDLSEGEGLSESHFPDGYHLNSEGARITTEKLLRLLR